MYGGRVIKGWLFVALIAVLAANIYDIFLDEHRIVEDCSMSEAYINKKAELVSQGKKAFVVGGTGEVGKELVKALLKEKIFSRLVLFGRRKVTYEDELYKDVEQRVIDFDKLENHVDEFKGFDVGYSCLGTTRSRSGADGFYKVDHDYVVNTAKLALDGGCRQLHLITSVGANKDSMFLYPRTKGEVEEELKAMKFDNLFIYRPGLLLCDRAERRAFEKAFMLLTKPFVYMFPTAISVPTPTVAMAMINNTISASSKNNVEMLVNTDIHEAAKCE